MTSKTKLGHLRKLLAAKKLDAFLIPSNDEYMGEYVPASAKRLEWLTGFTGSAGMAIVTKDGAAFFTDGRYVLQAKEQVSEDDFDRFNSAHFTPLQWLEATVKKEAVIGFDPWLHTEKNIQNYKKAGYITRSTTNLVDEVWKDRPALPCGKIEIQEYDFTGQYSSDKRKLMVETIKKNKTNILVLTAPDSICWLLNIRGNDVPCTPFVHAIALLTDEGNVLLFIDRRKLDEDTKERLKGQVLLIDTEIAPGETQHPIEQFIENCSNTEAVFQLDPSATPYWFIERLLKHGLKVVRSTDPCQLPKACKNPVELVGIRKAHVRDGLAVVRLLHWLDEQAKAGTALTELSVTAQLTAFREKGEHYRGPSFETIAGFGEHGAIVHYRATDESNLAITKDNLLLLDSGAQYLDGTTDITRTIAIGTPTAEQKNNFTLVLKGHIALATANFPEGTTGSQLDVLARQYLWKAGMDYDHGTGHGVGCYLSVHEGPQRISKKPNYVPLQPGMILSNEPGYYKAGEYGIRIENLVTVIEKTSATEEHNAFLCFDTLTLVPIDRRLIDESLLSKDEVHWMNTYHATVLNTLQPLLSREDDKATLAWLTEACAVL